MYFEDYFEEVLELVINYDITIDEVVYNKEHFENCYEQGMQPDDAIKELEKEMI